MLSSGGGAVKQQIKLTQDSRTYRTEAAVTAWTNQSYTFTLTKPFTMARARRLGYCRDGMGRWSLHRSIHARSVILVTIKSPYATSY